MRGYFVILQKNSLEKNSDSSGGCTLYQMYIPETGTA
jgi:hypothetical protein